MFQRPPPIGRHPESCYRRLFAAKAHWAVCFNALEVARRFHIIANIY